MDAQTGERSLITATVTDAHGRVMEAHLVLSLVDAHNLAVFAMGVALGDRLSGPLTLKQAANIVARFAP